MTHSTLSLRAQPASTALAPSAPVHPLRQLLALVAAWRRRAQQRRALLELNDHLLKDIGLCRADVWRETQKPFWKP